MTSASELFYNRRHRFGRNTDGIGLDSSPDPTTLHPYSNNRRHHHQQSHGNRQHAVGDGADSTRRSSYIRQHCHRTSNSEHGSARFGQVSSRSPMGSSAHAENSSNRSSPILTANDRLPGTVLLARARLLERLRGVSSSGNRQSVRAPPDMEDLRIVGSGDWVAEISPSSLVRGSTSIDWSSDVERMHLFMHEVTKSPPGLTQEAMDSLQLEVFSSSMTKIDGLQDCSICLENFRDGEELIRLSCDHRFHSACLNPWLRCSGDCPYCRRAICRK